MARKYKKTKEDKLYEVATQFRYYCTNKRCGGSVVIYPFERRDSKICVNCGHKVFNDAEKQKHYDFMLEMQTRLKTR